MTAAEQSPMDTPVVRHFLVCRRAKYDLDDSVTPYTLEHLVFRARPPAGTAYPFVVQELWVFALLVGTGIQEVWVEVVYRPPAESVYDDDDDPELVVIYGPFVTHFGPEPANRPRGWCLRSVPFDRPGRYEFRLLHEGVVIAEEQIQLED